jgi:tetratricopeptide (TPR) repeat protein
MAASYDAFLSFDPADAEWVERWLLPRLQDADLTIATAFDFALGRPRLINIEQTIDASRHTLLVLSPAWLASQWNMFAALLSQTSDPEGLLQRTIPLLHQPCELPRRIAMLDAADFTGASDRWEPQFQRLLRAISPVERAVASIPQDSIPNVAPLPSGSRMPFASNPLFVGRDDDLRTLGRTLSAGTTTVIAAATGLGGIGKTQLATEFVHRYGQFFSGGVFWLSFADATAVPGEIAACGGPGALDLPNFAALSPPDQVARVRQEWQHATPRLLVFDNCEDEQLLADWRPTSGGCQVLLTARRGEWDASLGVRSLPLEVLPRASSVALLRNFRPDLPFDDPDLAAITGELGNLPLALHMAGSYLKQYRADVSPADYLAELHAAPLAHESLLGEDGARSPTNHERNVGRSFRLSYDKLVTTDAIDALALDLLAHAACFAPGEPIPRDLLLKTVELPDKPAQRRATRAIRRLVDLGLLEVEEDAALRLHRLVVAFLRAEGSDAAGQRAVEQVLIDIGYDLLDKGFPAPLSAIQAHLRYVTDAARDRDDRRASNLCTIMGRYLRMVSSYAAARPYAERALAIEEGRDDPDEYRISPRLDTLAGLLRAQGDYTAARSLYERALAIDERMLGPNHSDTAASLNNLAGLLQAQGDDAAARSLYERALAIYEQALGPNHPDTALSLNNLAMLLQAQGDYTAARPLVERALAIREQVLGPNHPDTADSLNNLALLLQAQGDDAAARPLVERALAIREQVLGPNHPATASSLWWIGGVLMETGDLDGARERLTRAVAIFTRVLGANHQSTQNCQRHLDALDWPAPGEAS